jgi:uncharacterized protein YcfL
MDTNSNIDESKGLRPADNIPNILSANAQIVKYKAPKLKNFISYVSEYKQALEVTISTDQSFPVQADSPMLFIGDLMAQEAEMINSTTYRFYWFDMEGIKEGIPLSLDWALRPSQGKKASKFRLEIKK